MIPLDIGGLRSAYETGVLTPEDLVDRLYREFDARPEQRAWVYRLPREEALARARRLGAPGEAAARLPLYGVPFSVKDNIDVAGMPTTMGCSAYAYVARRSALVVEALERAGALCLGKANLDQFGSGLSGTHSPFGACRNVFSPAHLSGGSSSGSAIGVAEHQVSFALATDMAGSARIPAALNNVVALKPSSWLLPRQGLARTTSHFDTAAVLACNVRDAALVRDVVADRGGPEALIPRGFRYAVPSQLDFCGDRRCEELFTRCTDYLRLLGGTQVRIDFAPFAALGELFQSLSLVEGHMFLGDFVERSPAAVLPFVRQQIDRGHRFTAGQALRVFVEADHLKHICRTAISDVTFLLTPTVPTHFRIDEEASEPVRVDEKLGTYTRFVNLLGAPALAVPAGFREDGLPFGVSLVGHEGFDARLEPFGRALHEFSSAGAGRLCVVASTRWMTSGGPPPELGRPNVGIPAANALDPLVRRAPATRLRNTATNLLAGRKCPRNCDRKTRARSSHDASAAPDSRRTNLKVRLDQMRLRRGQKLQLIARKNSRTTSGLPFEFRVSKLPRKSDSVGSRSSTFHVGRVSVKRIPMQCVSRGGARLAISLLMMMGCSSSKKESAPERSAPVAEASPAATPKKTAEPLRIGYSDWPGWVAWEIGIQKKWFEEEGVSVDFKWFEYVPSMEAFSAGKVDAVTMTNGDALVTGSSGAPSVAILLNDYSNGNDMVVARPGVGSMTALKGKKVGVEVGFVSHLLLIKALQTAGLTDKDIEIVNVPTDQTPQLLKSGSVDAVVAWQPNSGQALADVAGSKAIFTSADVPGLIYDVLAVSPKSLSERRSDWKKVVRVWFRIADFLAKPENLEEAATIMAARVGMEPAHYKTLMKGTYFLGLAGNEKHFKRGETLESVYYSSRVVDEFQVANDVYKRPAEYERYLDPSIVDDLAASTASR